MEVIAGKYRVSFSYIYIYIKKSDIYYEIFSELRYDLPASYKFHKKKSVS